MSNRVKMIIFVNCWQPHALSTNTLKTKKLLAHVYLNQNDVKGSFSRHLELYAEHKRYLPQCTHQSTHAFRAFLLKTTPRTISSKCFKLDPITMVLVPAGVPVEAVTLSGRLYLPSTANWKLRSYCCTTQNFFPFQLHSCRAIPSDICWKS